MLSHDFTHLLLQCCKCPDKEVEDGGWEGLLEGEHAGSGITRELDEVDEVAKSLLNGAFRKEQYIDHQFSPETVTDGGTTCASKQSLGTQTLLGERSGE